MKSDEFALLREYVEAQTQCETLRIETVDLVRETMGALRPIDGRWNECGPHTVDENRWYRDRANSIRLEVEKLAPAQIAMNERQLLHNEELQYLLKGVSSESDNQSTQLLTAMRDFARSRMKTDFPQLLEEIRRISREVQKFEIEVGEKCQGDVKPVSRKSGWSLR